MYALLVTNIGTLDSVQHLMVCPWCQEDCKSHNREERSGAHFCTTYKGGGSGGGGVDMGVCKQLLGRGFVLCKKAPPQKNTVTDP